MTYSQFTRQLLMSSSTTRCTSQDRRQINRSPTVGCCQTGNLSASVIEEKNSFGNDLNTEGMPRYEIRKCREQVKSKCSPLNWATSAVPRRGGTRKLMLVDCIRRTEGRQRISILVLNQDNIVLIPTPSEAIFPFDRT